MGVEAHECEGWQRPLFMQRPTKAHATHEWRAMNSDMKAAPSHHAFDVLDVALAFSSSAISDSCCACNAFTRASEASRCLFSCGAMRHQRAKGIIIKALGLLPFPMLQGGCGSPSWSWIPDTGGAQGIPWRTQLVTRLGNSVQHLS